MLSQTPPKVLAIDEFKGNTGGEKYQCILTDSKTGVLLDILPNRTTEYLLKYFKQWDLDNRKAVRYFVSDMWQPYTDLAAVLFKNSKRILSKRSEKLNDYQKERVNAILYISDNLRIAYELKEMFYKIVDANAGTQARDLMLEWIYAAQSSGLDEYVKCSNTMINCQKGILNSIDVPYTNGFTEGSNNKIKVLKRNAYGYRNFKCFRNRILHIFNHKNIATNQEKEVA